jgi:hypothetical protein
MHGERYGELVDFDPNSAHSWQQVGFPRALLTFQAQEALALALSTAVDILTTSAGSGGNSQWLALVSGGLRSADEEVLWSSYYHQEFATPAKFDPEVILEKAQNQLNNAVDEIELLQTDPEQMRQHVWDTKQHTYFPPKRGKKADEDWTTVARVIVCGRTKSDTLAKDRGRKRKSEGDAREVPALHDTRSQVEPGSRYRNEVLWLDDGKYAFLLRTKCFADASVYQHDARSLLALREALWIVGLWRAYG